MSLLLNFFPAIISGPQTICLCYDGRLLGYGGVWKEPWIIDVGSKRFLNIQGEILAVWGRSDLEQPQPWSPLTKDHQRANLHIYWVGARGPDLITYKKTDGEPISVKVCRASNKSVILVEQKVSQRGILLIFISSLNTDLIRRLPPYKYI